MPTYSSYSHRSQNRFLVSCITLLIGVPLMCCCLGVIFYGVLPRLEQADLNILPIIIISGLFLALLVTVLGLGVYFFWFRKKNS